MGSTDERRSSKMRFRELASSADALIPPVASLMRDSASGAYGTGMVSPVSGSTIDPPDVPNAMVET